MEENLLQVALHLGQSLVQVTVGEQVAAGVSRGSRLYGAVHGEGEGAHPSLQAGDVGLDLAEKLRVGAVQLLVQEAQFMADGGEPLYGRGVGLNLRGCRQLKTIRRVRERVSCENHPSAW